MSLVLLCHSFRCLLTFLESVTRLDHISPISNHSTLLDGRGVAGHDDVGSESECSGSVGECLCMISRGMGADCGDGLVHLEEFVEGASGLECSYLLKVLALE